MTSAEDRLEAWGESEERLRLALEAADMGAWSWDLHRNEMLWSSRCKAFFGLSPQTLVNYELFLRCIHPDDRESTHRAVHACLEDNEPYQAEFRVIWPDQSIHWIAAKGHTQRDASGGVARMLGVCLNIDDRKKMDAHLREVQKLESVGLLAGGIVHDFNNLLTAIQGNVSLAAASIPEQSVQHHMLERALSCVARAADLTRQLLAYAGKGAFVIRPLDLSKEIAEIVELLRASVPKKVEIDLDLTAGLPRVEMDPGHLQQLLMNLVLNSAEAISETIGGTVAIRTQLEEIDATFIAEQLPGQNLSPGLYVCLHVTDNGCGMDEPTKEKIFDPFYTTKFVGRGLGLAAVQGIVRSLNGALKVESQPGKGTRFNVFLPATHSGSEEFKRPAPGDVDSAGCVLVADDEPELRDLMKNILERNGHSVLVAGDGGEVLATFRANQHRVRLVILDLTMPVLSGDEVLPLLKEHQPNIPVILTSGFDEPDTLRRSHRGAIAAYLQKPYTPTELMDTVKTALASQSAAFRNLIHLFNICNALVRR